jgi:hypothetical protein
VIGFWEVADRRNSAQLEPGVCGGFSNYLFYAGGG